MFTALLFLYTILMLNRATVGRLTLGEWSILACPLRLALKFLAFERC